MPMFHAAINSSTSELVGAEDLDWLAQGSRLTSARLGDHR